MNKIKNKNKLKKLKNQKASKYNVSRNSENKLST